MQKVLVPVWLKSILDQKFKAHRIQPVYLKSQKPANILKQAPDISGAILMVDPFRGDLMAKLPNFKIAARFGVGYDNIDVDYAGKHGIWATHTPGANAISVAENTVADMLILSKHLYSTSREMRGEKPVSIYPQATLAGKTIGIVGYGHIARRVIKILSSFGVKVLIWDRHPKTSEYGQFVDWDTLFRQSDYISLHIPATPQTTHIVDLKTFKMMKDSAFIVNFGRGALINQQDLVTALKQHLIKGAGLDVFEKEPLPQDSELRQLPNVFMTPHNAGMTVEARRKTANMAADDVIRVLEGHHPKYPVNKLS